MLFVPKAGISQRALNQLKRLAAFKNPEFYKNQAMRMPTYNKPRIICCADDTYDYLCLPRGSEQDLRSVFDGQRMDVICLDKTNHGNTIAVAFNRTLRDKQPQVVDRLLEHDIGVLSGTTAFGKTVVAIKLIAERKVNTLIIVDKASLITQWKNKLTEFLEINEPKPVSERGLKKRGRKKARSIIGQLGQGKNSLGGIIDIALMQSLNRKNEVRDCVKDYKARAGVVEINSSEFIYDKSNFLPVYSNDILAAEREILIVSPFVTKRRTMQMMQQLEIALRNKVRVIVVTRPPKDFGEKAPTALQGILDILQHAGVKLVFRSNIHQKFALIDQKVVWYGSINLLSFGNAEESIMRLESPNIASELLKSKEKQGSRQ